MRVALLLIFPVSLVVNRADLICLGTTLQDLPSASLSQLFASGNRGLSPSKIRTGSTSRRELLLAQEFYTQNWGEG